MNKQMKYILIFGFVILNLGINLNAQTTIDSLKPKMKMVKETSIGIIDEEDEIELERYKTDSTYLFGTEKRVFNRKGKLIEWNSFNSLLSSEVFRKYKLNKNGEWESSEIINSNGKILNMIYEYNSNNNLISIKTYENTMLIKAQKIVFDDVGNIKETILNEIDKNLEFRIFSVFNDKGKLLERTIHDKNNHIKERRSFHYDNNGKEIENIVNYGDNNEVKIILEYDKINNNNISVRKHYNKTGKLIKKIEFEYTYDDFNNWVIKKKKTDGVITSILEREIEYYE